jgi:hypothetical protein
LQNLARAPRSSRRRLLRAAVLLLAVATAGVFGIGAAPAQAAVSYDGSFTFDKNASDPTNSTLTWTLYRTDLDPPRKTTEISWRAGSGIGTTDVGEQPCTKNKGWLPNGSYSVTLHENFHGSKIHGVVFQLSDKACKPGSSTERTELFIHSEMNNDGGQTCTSNPDDPTCWEGNGDYKSNGCVKLKPADVKEAASYFKVAFKAEKTYSNKLNVVS